MNASHYRKIIAAHSSARFCIVRLDHVRLLKGDGTGAIVLSYLINLLQIKLQHDTEGPAIEKAGFWVTCPFKRIQADLGMTHIRLRRALQSLVDAKLLQSRNGKGNVRLFKIMVETLESLDRGEGEGAKKAPRKPSGNETLRPGGTSSNETLPLEAMKHCHPHYSNNLSKNLSPDGTSGDSVRSSFNLTAKESPSDFAGKLASECLSKLKRAGKVVAPVKLTLWGQAIDKLRRGMVTAGLSLGRAEARIKRVFRDHLENLRAPYQPQCWSAVTMAEKFIRLEAAMQRRLGDDVDVDDCDEEEGNGRVTVTVRPDGTRLVRIDCSDTMDDD